MNFHVWKSLAARKVHLRPEAKKMAFLIKYISEFVQAEFTALKFLAPISYPGNTLDIRTGH